MLLGRSDVGYPYGIPYISIQNAMWLVFFVGMGEVFLRFKAAGEEERQITLGLLPADLPDKILERHHLDTIENEVKEAALGEGHFLQRLIYRTIIQIKTSHSVELSHAIVNSSLDLMMHEVELRYNIIKYTVWLIPTLGFIGTVVGIADAMAVLVNPPVAASGARVAVEEWIKQPEMLQEITRQMGVAFYTTFVGLIQSAALLLAVNLAQGREEHALNRSGQYVLDHLTNRYVGKAHGA